MNQDGMTDADHDLVPSQALLPQEQAGGLEALVAARRVRIDRFRELGQDPYPSRSERSHSTVEAGAAFLAAEAENAAEGIQGVLLAGRLVGAIRRFGGSAFVHLQDGAGQLQLHLRRNLLGDDAFAAFLDLYDIGDFVNARGSMFRTKSGEISLAVDDLRMLAKSLLPLPEKWHGLQDVETRYRQRYLDLITSAESRERFVKRSRILSAMRRFLDGRGFLEVETPVLQPIYGGGAARPFTTHYHALEQEMFLRIADELYLKRLLVGGFERVYEICKDFRNEGIDRTHLPEFTMMECYWAYADYQQMLTLTESMISGICQEVNEGLTVELEGRTLDFSTPWRRLTVRQAIQDATGIDIEAHWEDLDGLRQALRELNLACAPQPTWARTVDELIGEYVEPSIWNPTFLLDYPVALSPLAKRKTDDPRYVERFEPLIAGFELGNCFTELNDPIDQRGRFEEAARQKASGDDEAQPLDEDFLRAMEHGMPPAGGLGIGIDRLVMVLTGTMNIRDVVLFPQLRQR
ncbi:MAG: lysine--tRNA ligase [Anaerolineae bacterium]